MKQLEGKNSVISGAAGGMGRVACREFCEAGASVIGVDLNEEAGRALEEELTADGLDFVFVPGNASVAADVEALASVVADRFDGLDVLYNNAGVVLGKPVLETTEEEWDLVHNSTLKSTFMMTRGLVPLMKGRKGSVVNVSSTGGLVGFEFMSAYCAAKGGVLLFSKACAIDLAPDIRVNAICPGVIDTPMPRAFVSKLSDEEANEVWTGFEQGHLALRVGEPQEVVSMARYLASDEASFVTGAAIPVDGGWTAK